MIERVVIWSVAMLGLVLLLSTCGAEAECGGACSLPILAVAA